MTIKPYFCRKSFLSGISGMKRAFLPFFGLFMPDVFLSGMSFLLYFQAEISPSCHIPDMPDVFKKKWIRGGGYTEITSQKGSLSGMSTLLDFALKYLNHGLAVIPLWPDARKNPHLKDTKEFNHRLPTEAEWKRWARVWSDANIGAITGYWLNYVALDFDDQLTYDVWRKKAGELNTWIVQTRRGYHVWFKVQDDPGHSRLFVRGDLEVLLRAKGGYCIVPPSIHHTGAAYHTINKVLPLTIPTIGEVLKGWEEKSNLTEKSTIARAYVPTKTTVRIEDLIPPIKEHPNYRGAYLAWCPFHDDKTPDGTPSAWVNIREQRFGCNVCFDRQYWDVINVYAMLNSMTNGQAYKELRVRA